MKKLFFAIALLGMAASCTLNDIDNAQKAGKNTIKVVAGEETRMAIATDDDVTFKHIWEEGDSIAVFNGRQALKYTIVGKGGDVKADFAGDELTEGAPYPVFYPYSDAINIYELASIQNLFAYEFPSSATYKDGDHIIGGNVMYGFCDGTSVNLKNVCGYLRITLSAQELSYLDTIEITAIGGEPICGPALVGTDEYGTPQFMFDSEKMDPKADYSKFTVKFDQSRWITATGTSFYVALPPVELSKGLEFRLVGDFSGDTELFLKSSSATLERNTVLLMPRYNVKISYGLLTDGESFNKEIKTLANGSGVTTINAIDVNIKKVAFKCGQNMEGIEGSDVSAMKDGSVIATYADGVITVYTSFDELRTGSSVTGMFMNLRALTSLESFDLVNTKGTSKFNKMFYRDIALTELDLTSMETRAATNMSYMFDSTTVVKTIDLSTWNTSAVTDMSFMFSNCYSLTDIKVSDAFNTSNVTTMDNMFEDCKAMPTSAFKHIFSTAVFNTEKVKDFRSMFNRCYEVTELDLSGFESPAATRMTYMFNDCKKLVTLDMRNMTHSSKTGLDYIWAGCVNVKTLRIDKFTLWLSSVYDYMYYICSDTASKMLGYNATASSPICVWCTEPQVPKSLLYGYSYNINSYNRKRFVDGAMKFYYPGKTDPWDIVCTSSTFTSATAPAK